MAMVQYYTDDSGIELIEERTTRQVWVKPVRNSSWCYPVYADDTLVTERTSNGAVRFSSCDVSIGELPQQPVMVEYYTNESGIELVRDCLSETIWVTHEPDGNIGFDIPVYINRNINAQTTSRGRSRFNTSDVSLSPTSRATGTTQQLTEYGQLLEDTLQKINKFGVM